MSEPNNDMFAYRYTVEKANEIEKYWQDKWENDGTYNADNPVGNLKGSKAEKERFYLLDMFPFPSGKGLHVGHPLGYIATDVVGRYQRMRGKNVLHTLGYDAFGLPAEQYAVQTGQHPRLTTEENIANMQRQLRQLGLGHDQRRVISTTDDEYVKWTQWVFLKIFNAFYDPQATRHDGKKGSARPISELVEEYTSGIRKPENGKEWAELTKAEQNEIIDSYRLAYVSHAPVNWCPGLGTVLANEEVTADGKSERGNFPVFKSALRQWMMRITAYGDRLVEDLDLIDWPEKVRSMQRNWIGKSTGATVTFEVDKQGVKTPLEVYTTRPDTLFGASFMVVAPDHPILTDESGNLDLPMSWPEGTKQPWTNGYTTPAQALEKYRQETLNKTDIERSDESRQKTGIFTGYYATNPLNGEQIPVFAADYVLMGYGTGAIMAVPAHDERDFEFATKFELPIKNTIQVPENHPSDQAWTGEGIVVNSANAEIDLNGLDKESAKAKVIAYLEEKNIGKATVTYRLRDWLFSRQRYWGEPFPVVYDEEGQVHSLPESMLPVTLPEIDNFLPRTFDPQDADSKPEPPLGRAKEWIQVELDLGDGVKTYYRDMNTMPNWAGSCWYELRYLDPQNDEELVASENEKYWMGPHGTNISGGADLYVGGVEHAVLHLLYSRFWHKVLYDLGYVSSCEPFHKLFNQGYVQAYAYTDSRGQYVPADEVEGDEQNGFTYRGEPVNREYGKMGKSLKNIVTPDDMCKQYGADTFRVYEMSMGPLDVSRPWDTRAVVGAQRFLQRLWRNIVDENTDELLVVDEQPDDKTARLMARTIADVTQEYDNMRVNTAIAKAIVLNNHLTAYDVIPRVAAETLVKIIAPVAPHIAEELWSKLGHDESVVYAQFPVADESKLVEDSVTCIIQIAGKLRGKIEVSPSIDPKDLEELVLSNEVVVKHLEGKEPMKVIVRAPKLVNVVPGK
ncbi:leucine--tRNA ligase [Actinomyces sp. zg-332]|uniref:leucine--tRNA ligase n=1 Tax=Actinomyces sp. zg-332 TaxID=2708340 RepID=UPI0014216A77|nr:leucine--tRNA ligase [Actinomyces sp. zg-332]QPK94389.1 leucine--tRNA ligase [Actinomyces sp. zg-332]